MSTHVSDQARITVAIPTRNRSKLLREALASVLRQSVEDLEIFVSDNASTDDTAEVVASFRDRRVQYTRLAHNIGLHGNLSRCLRLGRAPFMVILQDDDLMLPGNLERKLAVLERYPNVGIAHASFQLIGPNGGIVKDVMNWSQARDDMIEPGQLFIRRSMTYECRINMSAAVMRRSAVTDERFDEADGLAPDFGLWLRIALGADVALIAEPLTALRIHEGRESVRAGINVVKGDSHVSVFRRVALAQQVIGRFLDGAGYGPREARELRRVSREGAREELLRAVKTGSLPKRSPIVTLRLLYEAARIEPRVLRSSEAGRALVASLLGRRGRELVRRLLNRAPGVSTP
jgi:glycosyltransferase involved in cell wall biosynthesis